MRYSLIIFLFLFCGGIFLFAYKIFRYAKKEAKGIPLIIAGCFSGLFMIGSISLFLFFCHLLLEEGLNNSFRSSVKFGYINGAGKVVIPLKFTKAGPFADHYARVEEEGVSYYIDTLGRKTTPPAGYLNHTLPVLADTAFLSEEVKEYGIVEVSHYAGEKAIRRNAWKKPEGSDTVIGRLSFNRALTRVLYRKLGSIHVGGLDNRIEYRFGYKDSLGKMVIPALFNKAYSFHEGLASVQDTLLPTQKKYLFFTLRSPYQSGYIRTDGSYLCKPVYEDAGPFSENRAAISAPTE
ncbi:MAG: WG repeat-containing protein [Bacteroidia bacterium]